jgi:8-oxo-dGTP pyrophosphatase MutT (NUDIX family)
VAAAPLDGGVSDAALTRAEIRRCLAQQAGAAGEEISWLAYASPELAARIIAGLPARSVPAAVLIPLIPRETGWTVLLTERSATLRDHAGQISFPGGRIEVTDRDAWAAALRESQEEIGLRPESVEFAGFLPDQLIATGYRVTPIVGFVTPDHALQLAVDEVHDAFEVPLDFLFDPRNHRPRLRHFGDLSLETVEIPYGSRAIWGATAAMLMTLRRLLSPSAADTP